MVDFEIHPIGTATRIEQLEATLDPALTERAGEVLEQLGLFVKPQWSTGAPAYVCKTAADLITALLARIAAQEAVNKGLEAERDTLRAERDDAYAKGFSDAENEISATAIGQQNVFLHNQLIRAKAEVEKLRALLFLKENYDCGDVVDAALTRANAAALDKLIAGAEARIIDSVSSYIKLTYGDRWSFLDNPIDRERILDALEPHPDPRDEVIARLVEALVTVNGITEASYPQVTSAGDVAEIQKVARAALAASKKGGM